MSEHPNVTFVRNGFAALAAGDLDTVLTQWAPGLQYHGSDASGRVRDFANRDEFFGMLME
ncbi:MAG: hypothetical protein HYU28_08715 [Actinobacteria bacterium]|nr:hypothetical protein [Actinomycetota bacterium]